MDPKLKDNGFVGQFMSHHGKAIAINLFRGFTKAVASQIIDQALGSFLKSADGEVNVFGNEIAYKEAVECTLKLGLESFVEWGLSKFIDGESVPEVSKNKE